MITVTILGTAAMMPLPDRALTSIYLNCKGHNILFDCGEGTQSAARKSGVSMMKVELIALTHFHGDHILGLPGMLQSMKVLGREDKLTIVGPKGINSALKPIMDLAGDLPYEVEIKEIAGTVKLFNDATLSAFSTDHKVTSQGYIFELSRPGKFIIDKAIEYGIEKESWKSLQHGETVNGITPEMVLGEPRKGLKVVYSGDTMPCEGLKLAAKDADLLICEATFPTDEYLKQATSYKHMTVQQACEAGKEAKQTVLVHFSQMVEDVNVLQLTGNTIAGTDGMKFDLMYSENE